MEKTIGCKGCERIAEGVRHTDECHARIGRLLEEEKIAKEAESKKEEKPVEIVDTSMHVALKEAVKSKLKNIPIVEAEPRESKHLAPRAGKAKPENENDFWAYDDQKGAWKRVHVRPVGNDCPFEVNEVSSKRETIWSCRGKTSTFGDDWQEMSPNRRISSKSWTGVTYFYPLEKPTNVKARIIAMTCNVQTEPPRV